MLARHSARGPWGRAELSPDSGEACLWACGPGAPPARIPQSQAKCWPAFGEDTWWQQLSQRTLSRRAQRGTRLAWLGADQVLRRRQDWIPVEWRLLGVFCSAWPVAPAVD